MKPVLIDTHAHMYDEKIYEQLEDVVAQAEEAGVKAIYMPNVDVSTIDAMHEVQERFPLLLPLMGLHPCSVELDWKDNIKIIESWIEKKRYYGIGETGIDLYWDTKYVEEQQKSFYWQLDIAREMKLPIIIHSRSSIDMCISMVAEKQNGNLTGVFHCFGGEDEHALQIKDLNFHIGIGGVVTYKKSNLTEILLNNGLDNVVLETDSPYLPPTPHRGKTNQPQFITLVNDKIAEIMGLSAEEVASITTKNANKLYKIHQN